MVFDWNDQKNNLLKKERAISFERIVVAIEENHLLDIKNHPNNEKYGNQLLLIVEVDNYVCVVPCVVQKDVYFLKTVFKSRKYTDEFLPGRRGK